eukprot:NODE_997_length_2757_cov_0.665538.p3 type:complete len:123 gc:universal NODE_997_length_2757_cov_0.665538:647-1015(+)
MIFMDFYHQSISQQLPNYLNLQQDTTDYQGLFLNSQILSILSNYSTINFLVHFQQSPNLVIPYISKSITSLVISHYLVPISLKSILDLIPFLVIFLFNLFLPIYNNLVLKIPVFLVIIMSFQ